MMHTKEIKLLKEKNMQGKVQEQFEKITEN